MEATRQKSVDLSQFKNGEPREKVLEVLGTPTEPPVKTPSLYCDVYRLYTRGPKTNGDKARRIGRNLLTDFTSLGGGEVGWTMQEMSARSDDRRMVQACYDNNGKLWAIKEFGPGSADAPNSNL
jgi:hypothetical protein